MAWIRQNRDFCLNNFLVFFFKFFSNCGNFVIHFTCDAMLRIRQCCLHRMQLDAKQSNMEIVDYTIDRKKQVAIISNLRISLLLETGFALL